MTEEIVSDPLHIVMVMPTYLPETYGGAEQQGRKFSKELVRRGHKVTILAPRLHKSTLPKEDMDGVRIIRFSLGALPNLGGPYILSFLKWCFHIVLWLWSNREDYHVIHVFHGRLHAVPAVMASKIVRKPVLIKIGRGGDHFDLSLLEAKTLYGRLFEKMVRSWATGYIANSSEIVEDLRAKHISENRIHAIANGVELPDLNDAKRQVLNQEPSRRLFRYLYLGRLDTEKNVQSLVEAFAKLDSKDKIHLDIVGDGPLLPDLQKIADKSKVADRITFCGRTNDVGSYLQAADYFVSASTSEGMSNALLEAMSYGVVPIVTNVSGVENLVRDGIQGLVFDADPIERFVEILKKSISLSTDEYMRLSTAARDRIEQNFSLAKIADDHVRLYHSVLTNVPS